MVIGPQDPLAVEVHAERLMYRRTGGVDPPVLDDDVSPLLTEGADRRAQLEMSMWQDLRTQEDLDVSCLKGKGDVHARLFAPGQQPG